MNFRLVKEPVFSALNAGIVWFALISELYLTLSDSAHSWRGVLHGISEYFSYFTILTNILCASIFTAYATKASANPFVRLLRSPALLTVAEICILGVSVIYHVMLRNLWSPTGLEAFSDSVLHYVTPLCFSLLYLKIYSNCLLDWKSLSAMMIYPSAYSVFILARGAVTSEYPYPFIDVNKIGYIQASLFLVSMLILFAITASGLIASNRLYQKLKLGK